MKVPFAITKCTKKLHKPRSIHWQARGPWHMCVRGLPCVTSVGEETPSLSETWNTRIGRYPRNPNMLGRERNSGMGKGLLDGVTKKGALSRI